MTAKCLQFTKKSAQIDRAEKGFQPQSRSNRPSMLGASSMTANCLHYPDSVGKIKIAQIVNMAVSP